MLRWKSNYFSFSLEKIIQIFVFVLYLGSMSVKNEYLGFSFAGVLSFMWLLSKFVVTAGESAVIVLG